MVDRNKAAEILADVFDPQQAHDAAFRRKMPSTPRGKNSTTRTKNSPITDVTLKDSDGATLNEVRKRAGFTGDLKSTLLKPGHYDSFVELHIEQGPLLEARKVPIGIVTAIAAPAAMRITIEGQGGHAGAVLMPDRHDAFLAAAELALALEASAKSTGLSTASPPPGVCDIHPARSIQFPAE